jgi:hypothetical protein
MSRMRPCAKRHTATDLSFKIAHRGMVALGISPCVGQRARIEGPPSPMNRREHALRVPGIVGRSIG